MTEKEKAQKGYLYDANYDKDLAIERANQSYLEHCNCRCPCIHAYICVRCR